MSWVSTVLGSLVGGATTSTIGEGLSGIGDAAIKIRSAVTGKLSAQEESALLLEIQRLETSLAIAQTEVNKSEASSGSLFVAGWRPALGWVCACSVFVYFVPRIILMQVLWFYQSWTANTLLPMPEMGIVDILGLTSSMLGVVGVRTYEKIKGVERKW